GPLGPHLPRPALPTLLHVEPAPTLRIHALGAHARARLAAAARGGVVLDVPAPERVSLLVRTRIEGRSIVVARAMAAPRAAGQVRLRVRLAAVARRLLQRQRVLHLTLSARQADQV